MTTMHCVSLEMLEESCCCSTGKKMHSPMLSTQLLHGCLAKHPAEAQSHQALWAESGKYW
jgi:hypothetical protein